MSFLDILCPQTYRPERADRRSLAALPAGKIKDWQGRFVLSRYVEIPFDGEAVDIGFLRAVQQYAHENWAYKTEQGDYWKTGVEMWEDKEGDCEDFAAGKLLLL